ncbi:hypothetical protein ZIOFF_037538 [Zingiber officinale]|uniref:RRM domain-containing protein n=1 Tax=Zingiber officinale TaxID=94328 RepID=A0A8J5GK89_ZINOF|nr:hypothetical protein ZIOFF_037538 [Zingiber officinale]
MTISEGIHQLDGLDWETRDCFSMSRRSTPPADLATPQVCVDLGLTAAAPVVSFPPASAETPRFLWIVKDPNLRDAISTPFHQLDLRFLKLPRCRIDLEGQNDLLQLVQPFGVVTKLVMLRAKNQALLQMHDVASAMNVIQYYTNVQPSVRGRNVYIQFSSHQELTTADQNSQGRKGDQDSPPNRILLATIHHMLYPITVEVLHQVFSPCGYVEKIVTFQKSAGFQALIQFDAQQSAVQARSSLQGRNIYDGCCQLDIQFSNLNELQVNYNNDRSRYALIMYMKYWCVVWVKVARDYYLYLLSLFRDFTNPSLPTDQRGRSSQQHGYGDAGSLYALQSSGGRAAFGQMGNAAAIAAAFGGGLPAGVTGTNDRSTILVTNLDPDKIDEDKLFNLFSMYGNIIRIKLLRNKPDHALVQMEDGFQAELAVHFLKGSLLFGKRLELNFSKYPSITPASDTHEYASSSLNRFNNNAVKNYKYCCSPTKMIHLSSLPQDITEEEILSHLEEHGTVVNTKLFEVNGKKQALVLFEDEAQATEALVFDSWRVINAARSESVSSVEIRVLFALRHGAVCQDSSDSSAR